MREVIRNLVDQLRRLRPHVPTEAADTERPDATDPRDSVSAHLVLKERVKQTVEAGPALFGDRTAGTELGDRASCGLHLQAE